MPLKMPDLTRSALACLRDLAAGALLINLLVFVLAGILMCQSYPQCRQQAGLAAGHPVTDELNALAALLVLMALLSTVMVCRSWKRQRDSIKALSKQEAKFRTIADYTFDWEYWQGPNQDIIYMTPACERVTGYAQAEFIADSGLLMRIIHPEDRPAMERHLSDIAGGSSEPVDFRIVRRDGDIRWIAHRCRVVAGDDGQPLGHRASNRDITEHKLNKARLAAERSHLRTLVETIPDLVWLKDPDGVYLACNPKFERFFGAKAAEIVGKSDYDFVDAELADFFRRKDREAMAANHPRVNEEWITYADNGQRALLETIKTPMRDAAGHLIGVLGIARDITAARHAQTALRASEEKLRGLYELSPLGIALTDMQGHFIEFNHAFLTICGYSEQELKALDYRTLTPEKYAADENRQQESLERNGRYGPYEKECRRKDGSLVPLCLNGVLVTGVDGKHYIWSIVEDITERKAAEAALLQSNADLEQFAYSVSHDMRQPLRIVVGHLQLLARGLNGMLDDDNRENLNFALDGAKRMDAMIVSLLDYSRVGRKTESKRWMLSSEPLDEALRFLTPAIEEAGAEIDISGDWPRIFASRDEMTRLFQNLIGNAVKYHEPDRPPRIQVHSAVTADGWRVRVRDDGIGIDPARIDRLFQFFSRLQSRARFEGTGMGLALCRRIVEHHGGRIRVESAGEKLGSTFIFELPIKPSDDEAGS